MVSVVDTCTNCSEVANDLRRAGIDVIIRYYSRFSWKVLTPREAVRLAAAGMQTCAVYQDGANPASFDEQSGYECGVSAFRYAKHQIRQPASSAIYFAVDFDASQAEVENSIVPFFKGVVRASQEESECYDIGVYGSGLVCREILDERLAKYTWLACSRGWKDTKNFDKSGRWNLKQHAPEVEICGISFDKDDVNPEIPQFGAFQLASGETQGKRYRVKARDGLRLRATPSTELPKIGLIPFGAIVYVVGHHGDWVLVDLEGDGRADGYLWCDLLQPVSAAIPSG